MRTTKGGIYAELQREMASINLAGSSLAQAIVRLRENESDAWAEDALEACLWANRRRIMMVGYRDKPQERYRRSAA